MREAIDEALAISLDMQDFVTIMGHKRYIIQYNPRHRNLTIRPVGSKKGGYAQGGWGRNMTVWHWSKESDREVLQNGITITCCIGNSGGNSRGKQGYATVPCWESGTR